MKKRFIEYDLPLAEISEQSAREKNIRHGHPSTLHIWWARRPLASSRATVLAALLDDPGPHDPKKRREIRELIEQITPWEAVKDGNSAAIKKAQKLIREQYGDKPPKVLDPFSGGGSIPLEALRLGCETYASDYNPVAVFIEKATLEWPQKFGIQVELPKDVDDAGLGMGGKKVNLLAYLVEKWAHVVLEEARTEIGRFYPEENGLGLVGRREVAKAEGWIPVGYLWARTIPCQNPTCGAEIPLYRQSWLTKKSNKSIAFRPIVDGTAKQVSFAVLEGKALAQAMENGFDPGTGTALRGDAVCPVCGQVTKAKQVRMLARSGNMCQRLVTVILHHPQETGKKYRPATIEDGALYNDAEHYLKDKISAWPYLESPLPDEPLPAARKIGNSGFRSMLYGMEQWQDMFNSRQKLSLLVLTEKVRSNYRRILDDCAVHAHDSSDAQEMAKAVLAYLAIGTSRFADYNTNLQSWEPLEKFGHTFGRQALPMTWDYAEANPFSGSAGCWSNQIGWVLRFVEANAWPAAASISVTNASATSLSLRDEAVDAIFSDPPYYDNVAYADLSDFFYVWLKRALGDVMAELFVTPVTPKSEEAIVDPGRQKDKHFFEEVMKKAFTEMHRVLKKEGIAVIVYAHKTTEGWETLLNSLVSAGFVVTGSWPLHTEMKNKVLALRSAILGSSIYMICRKVDRNPLGFWNDIQPQVRQRVEEKLGQFWNEGIAGGDFFISAIGPGMEAYSRYERVETYDGRSVTVLDLLQYIRQVATDFLVNRLLKDASSGTIDKEAQFYLTYRWTFLDNKVEYDDARKIASAEGVNLDRLAQDADSFVRKSGSSIEVQGPQKRGAIKDIQNMVDAMHLACRMWEQGHKSEIGKRLAEAGFHQSGAFWQFCQAVAECLPQGNKEKQLLEGLLLGKEQYQKAAAANSQTATQGQMNLGFEA